MPIGRYAPWFHLNTASPNAEPLSYRAWKALWQKLPKRSRPDLFHRIDRTDWDLLIILDACRYDVLDDVADSAVPEKAISPVTDTGSFLENAADEGLFEDTCYVSANPQTRKHPPGDEIEHVPIFDSDWDEDLRTVAPSAVYEEAERRVKEGSRTVAHTIQPHYPHVCEFGGIVRPVPNGVHPQSFDFPFDEDPKMQRVLASGTLDFSRGLNSYRAAVSFAWEKASNFAASLSNEGYTVAITADHGELFGEWGFVEHPVDVHVSDLVAVPWIVFSPNETANDQEQLDEKLTALGYLQ